MVKRDCSAPEAALISAPVSRASRPPSSAASADAVIVWAVRTTSWTNSAVCCALLADQVGRVHLGLDGVFHGSETRPDLADHIDDLADRAEAHFSGLVQPVDIGNNLLRGRLGLDRKRLDLARDNGKAAPGLARAGGLDGRVQGQQVGLFGNVGNQADHIGDVVNGVFQLHERPG